MSTGPVPQLKPQAIICRPVVKFLSSRRRNSSPGTVRSLYPPSNQIGDVYPPGAIMAGSARSLPPASIKTSPTETVTVRKGHYEPITTSFKHDGFQYRQIAREGDVAIYEQRWIRPGGELSENIAYEVVRIQRTKPTHSPAVNPIRPVKVTRQVSPGVHTGSRSPTKTRHLTNFDKCRRQDRQKPIWNRPETYWTRNKHKLKHQPTNNSNSNPK